MLLLVKVVTIFRGLEEQLLSYKGLRNEGLFSTMFGPCEPLYVPHSLLALYSSISRIVIVRFYFPIPSFEPLSLLFLLLLDIYILFSFLIPLLLGLIVAT